MRCTRNRNVGEASVNEFGMDLGVYIDQHALRSQTLRTMGCDGIAVIEVPHFAGIEAHDTVFGSIHTDTDFAILPNALNRAEVTVRNPQVSLRGRKLNFVSDSKFALDLAVRGDAT